MTREIDAETRFSLILRMRDSGDATAWSTFVEVYSPLLYGFCRMKGLQASDAADVTQETLMRVARAIKTFEYDRTKGMFRDWLATIVYNELRRYTSRKTVETEENMEQAVVTDGQSSEWSEHFQKHLFDTALIRCRSRFTKDTWCLFERSWLDKCSADEVAKEFDVGVEKVYVARSRVLKRLKLEVAILVDDIA